MSVQKTTSELPNPSNIITPIVNKTKHSGRVDINHLLARVRKEEKKEYKINLIFFGLFASLVLVVGILLSL